MKILIKMSSNLIASAMRELLRKRAGSFQAIADCDSNDIPDLQPDLILVDFSSLEKNIFRQWPQAKVVLIDTGVDENQLVSKLLYYKLHGIISTRTSVKLFKKALQEINAGQIWIDNSKLRTLIHSHETISGMQPLESFSFKERQIINLISQGLKNREIASAMAISEQTVKSHLNRIFRKGNITSRTQLLPLAMKLKPSLTQ